MKIIKIIISIASLFTLVNTTFAASVYTTAMHKNVAPGSMVRVGVYLNANKSINAVEGNIDIPDKLKIKSVEYNTSAITLWVEKPYENAFKDIRFSGITPGGVVGVVKLFEFVVEADMSGEYNFVPKDIKLYLNDGLGTELQPSISYELLTVNNQYQKVDDSIQDSLPPKDFSLTLTNDPQINGGKWSVLFYTNDDGSGVEKYQIAEVGRVSKRDGVIYPKDPEWRDVTSPALLVDQKLRSHIFVRAIDQKGNEKVAYLAPTHHNNLPVIISIMLIVLVCYYNRKSLKKFFKKNAK